MVTDRVTRLGYVYDSVADRITEACWLVALYLVGAPGWLAALCGGLAWLHEYIRARATAAGMPEVGAVTAGERPTRVILAIVGLFLAGMSGLVAGALPAGTVTVVLAIWVLFGLIGLVQLAGAVQAGLARPPKR
jgi:CDP-diacylglycerol--glycerol-3-phosphate 3-phosphatidyltransferase